MNKITTDSRTITMNYSEYESLLALLKSKDLMISSLNTALSESGVNMIERVHDFKTGSYTLFLIKTENGEESSVDYKKEVSDLLIKELKGETMSYSYRYDWSNAISSLLDKSVITRIFRNKILKVLGLWM